MVQLKTPGVYILEKNNSGDAIVQVATAVPVFIGYTAKASVNGMSFHMKPVMISSISEYEVYFGGGPKPVFSLEKIDDRKGCDVCFNGEFYSLKQSENSQFYLYNSLKLFFDNGGAQCYIISIGQYEEDPENLKFDKELFTNAIDLLDREQVPTMLLMPDSLLLVEEDGSYYSVLTYALAHCAKHKDKIALFDIYDAGHERPIGEDKNTYITRFRENIGLENLSYGACYYPWVKTSIVTENNIDYTYFDLELLKPVVGEKFAPVLDNLIKASDEGEKKYWDRALSSSPEYKLLKNLVAGQLSILPVTPAIAGLYTRTDMSKGVWVAPANKNLNSVISPTIMITNREQEDLNVDVIGGKSINAIRTFNGIGAAVVWGTRTLDGNSEWKYVPVRRLFILIEQSIKRAAFKVVFNPNVPVTWSVVKASINNFLTNLWRQGALVGASPSEAFSVMCGLGETMDQNDINEGIMRIQVAVAPSKPAEFIVISFEQKMGEGK